MAEGDKIQDKDLEELIEKTASKYAVYTMIDHSPLKMDVYIQGENTETKVVENHIMNLKKEGYNISKF